MVYWDRLRYRLLPYIYSVAGAVTEDGSTMMRPLVMDFPADAVAREVTDQYLFGPALLVNPVTAVSCAQPAGLSAAGGVVRLLDRAAPGRRPDRAGRRPV